MSRVGGRLVPVLIVLSAVAAGLLLMMDGIGFSKPQPPTKAKADRDQFAADRDQPTGQGQPMTIDGQRAMKYLTELCDTGPRISGTPAIKQFQDSIKTHFEKLGAKVEFQRWKEGQRSRPALVDLANITISWNPDRNRRVLVCSHYDTRPKADQEQNRGKWDDKFVSANDGTSGVALFMEMAHHMKGLPTTVGVDFVLFDAEEYVFSGPDGRDRYFIGSEHFRDEYKMRPPPYRYAGGVLLDLFAGKNPSYPIEQNSLDKAPQLVTDLWQIGAELGVTAFRRIDGGAVLDDHLALNAAGIPTVDVIDFSYTHWHKLSDLPDKCSADSMVNMAKVLSVWFQRAR